MFNPLKGIGDLKKLRDEAMKLQKELQQIEVFEEKGRVAVTLTGDMKIRSFKLSGEEMHDIKDVLNSALEKAQKRAAEKMRQMGGGLQGLLGGGQ